MPEALGAGVARFRAFYHAGDLIRCWAWPTSLEDPNLYGHDLACTDLLPQPRQKQGVRQKLV